MRTFMRHVVVAAVALIAAGAAGGATAHEERRVGPLVTVVGWLEEPAFAGFRNAVQLIASRDEEPVEGGRLDVEVIFGERDGTEKTDALDLRPAFGTPGEYRAFLIPTRPGTYTFHVTGSIGGRRIDQLYTSGEETFNDVREPTEAQFPAKDPSNAELATLSDRLEARLTASANSAKDTASLARILGFAGIGIGVIALVLGLVRKPRSR